MAKTCPHCHVSLPPVGDAFCIECGQALQTPLPERATPLQNARHAFDPQRFTFVGRLVILIYGFLGVSGTFALMAYLLGSLPAGRYSLFYFAAPFLILGFLLCANTFYFLEKMGVKIYEDGAGSASRSDVNGPST